MAHSQYVHSTSNPSSHSSVRGVRGDPTEPAFVKPSKTTRPTTARTSSRSQVPVSCKAKSGQGRCQRSQDCPTCKQPSEDTSEDEKDENGEPKYIKICYSWYKRHVCKRGIGCYYMHLTDASAPARRDSVTEGFRPPTRANSVDPETSRHPFQRVKNEHNLKSKSMNNLKINPQMQSVPRPTTSGYSSGVDELDVGMEIPYSSISPRTAPLHRGNQTFPFIPGKSSHNYEESMRGSGQKPTLQESEIETELDEPETKSSPINRSTFTRHRKPVVNPMIDEPPSMPPTRPPTPIQTSMCDQDMTPEIHNKPPTVDVMENENIIFDTPAHYDERNDHEHHEKSDDDEDEDDEDEDDDESVEDDEEDDEEDEGGRAKSRLSGVYSFTKKSDAFLKSGGKPVPNEPLEKLEPHSYSNHRTISPLDRPRNLPTPPPSPDTASPTLEDEEITSTDKEQNNTAEADRYREAGNQLFNEGKYIEATDFYSRAIELDDSNPFYFLNRAAGYSNQRRWKFAVNDCQHVLSLGDTVPPKVRVKALYRMVKSCLPIGFMSQAIEALEELNTVTPASEEINQLRGLVMKVQKTMSSVPRLLEQKSWNLVFEAISSVGQHVQEFPAEWRLYEMKAFAGTKDWDRVSSIADTVLKRNPQNAEALYMLALANYHQNRNGDAMQRCQDANRCGLGSSDASELLDRIKKVESKRNSGNRYFKEGNYDQAIEDYSIALAIETEQEDVMAALLSNRGATYEKIGEYDKAQEDCNAAIALRKSHFKAYRTKGKSHMAQGQWEEAVWEFQNALRYVPDESRSTIQREHDMAMEQFEANKHRVRKDPWQVLGLTRGASAVEIKRTYKKLSLQHHPDKGGNTDKFKQISLAYQKIMKKIQAQENELKRQQSFNQNSRRKSFKQESHFFQGKAYESTAEESTEESEEESD